jgi:dTDP-4-amino-4,6-dideoxygalactose transaminase
MITKAAFNDKGFVNNLVFTKSARDAWKLILESIKKEQGFVNALLPSYIGFTEREGSGIFDPVEATESDYSFYNIKNDLSVDVNLLESLIKTKKFNILLLVHYFGFCRNDLDKIKNICESNNIIFVEDCAHAFHLGLQKESLGVFGDFSFYSVHKYLPVNNGGILKNISKKIALLDLPKENQISFEAALQLLKADYKSIMKKRRSNFNLYKQKLSEVEGLEIMYDLKNDEIPQSFPVRINNKQREPLYFHLMNKDMPTIALYYRLIDELTVDEYPLSHKISEEILNLPLHQDTTDQDIEMIVEEIKKFLKKK